MKKGGPFAAGFTIVETMIVLAVTGALFVSIMLLVNGRAGKAQFMDAVNTLQQSLQQTIGEVQSGYYPNNANFSCTAPGSNGALVISPAGTSTQGTNNGCIFVGKVIQFAVNDGDAPDINIYTVAGRQLNGTSDVTNLTEARPKVVEPATDNQALRYGLTVDKMRYVSGGVGTNVGAFAVATSFQQHAPNSSGLLSGSQQINIIPVKNTSLGMTETAAIVDINNYLDNSLIDPDGGVQICLKSGTTSQQWGIITIGGIAGDSNVTLKIKQGGSCW